jgi:hypothetical protein
LDLDPGRAWLYALGEIHRCLDLVAVPEIGAELLRCQQGNSSVAEFVLEVVIAETVVINSLHDLVDALDGEDLV